MTTPQPAIRVSAIWLILVTAFAAAIGLWAGTRLFATPPQPPLQGTLLYPCQTTGTRHTMHRHVKALTITGRQPSVCLPGRWRKRWESVP